MSFPVPIELALAGAAGWRVTLALLVAALAGAAWARGWSRFVLGVIALVLMADCLFAAWLAHVGQI